jgi:hypothetical protein
MPDTLVVGLLLGSLLFTLGSHLGSRVAELRARERYREIMDSIGGDEVRYDDEWAEVRPLVGGWGCLVALLDLLKGLALLVAGGSLLYLLLRRGG